MKKRSLSKTCAVVMTAASMLFSTAFIVRADTLSDAAKAEIEAAKQTMERTHRADLYGASVEETRIAKEYLGSLQTLAQFNPVYEGSIEAANNRIAEAEKAEKRAYNLLQISLGTEEAQESLSIQSNDKQLLGIVDKNGVLQEAFSVQVTGKPSDPSAQLIIEDFPQSYMNYPGYHVFARYYAKEKLKESTEQSENAGKKNGTITVTGEMPEGGYADQVAVEVFVADDHSLVFLWDDDGSLRVTDKD